MEEVVIDVERVTKRFRTYRSIANHRILKTAVVGWFRTWGTRRDRLTDPNLFDVIRDVSFQVRRGDTMGIIGKNGAGKSTILRMIAGIYRPDGGRIRVDGRVAALIELGAGFHPDFTGRENILVNGIVLGLSKRAIRERFDAIVNFAEIGDFIDAPVRTYSSGMFMRLAFSLAVHVDPDILLIDEILSVGDEAFQRKCRALMETRIKGRHRTTLIVSHDLDLISAFCNRCVLIDPPRAYVFEEAHLAVQEFRRLQRAAAPTKITSDQARGIEISEFRLSADGKEATSFPAFSAAEIGLQLRFAVDIKEPIFGISVQRADSAQLYATNTARLGRRLDEIKTGETVRIRWTLQLRLTPAEYKITIAVADGVESNIVFWPSEGPILSVTGNLKAIPGAELTAAVKVERE